jgi:hypothetical protein
MADLVSQDIFDRLPERYQRRAREISARVGELKALLKRCDIPAIVDAAVRLQGQLRWQPETDHESFGSEFKTSCADLPEWAISEAANDFLAGRVDNHTGQFMPTCAEFARHARLIIRPFHAEMSILRREAEQLFERAEDERRRQIIELERQDPNQRRRIRAMIDEAVKGSAKQISAIPHTPIDEKTQAQLDALKLPQRDHVSKIPQTKAGRLK